jgi:hypothetical protein
MRSLRTLVMKSVALRVVGEIGGTISFMAAITHLPLANTAAIFQALPLAITLGAALVLLLASFIALTAIAAPSRPRPAAPTGACNLPPVPAPGQTVTWTLAGSPYEICQNITIPLTSTVIVEAGVHINFDPDMQVVVLGTMHLQGQAAQHIVLQAPAVFPPIIDIDGGVFDTAFSDFTGQVRVDGAVGDGPAVADQGAVVIQAEHAVGVAHQQRHRLEGPAQRPVGLLGQEPVHGGHVDAVAVVVELIAGQDLASHARPG